MRARLQAIGRAAVMLLAFETTLRGVLLSERVRNSLTSRTPEEGPARMAWTDDRLVALLTSDLGRDWTRTGFDYAWDPQTGWTRPAGYPLTDEHGCRDAGLARAPDATRIVLVGDSYTFGTDAVVTDTWGSQLEERHPGLDVHNLGMAAYDLLQATLRLEQQGARIAPRAVVLLGIDHDTLRANWSFFSYAKPWPEIDASGELVVHGVPVPAPWPTFVRGMLQPRAWGVVDTLLERTRRRRDYTADVAEGERRSAAVLERWVRSVRALGAVPILLAVPTPDELRAGDASPTGRPQDPIASGFFGRWCSGRDFPCREAWDEMAAAAPDRNAITAGAHWNRQGHAIVADLVERELIAAGVIPAPP